MTIYTWYLQQPSLLSWSCPKTLIFQKSIMLYNSHLSNLDSKPTFIWWLSLCCISVSVWKHWVWKNYYAHKLFTLYVQNLLFFISVYSVVWFLPSCLLVCLPPHPQEFVSTLGSNKVDHLIIIIIDIILENIIFAKALLKRNSVQLKLSTANN